MLNFYEFDSMVLKEWQETKLIKVIHLSVPQDFLFNSAQYVSIELKAGEYKDAKIFSIATSPTVKSHIEIAKKLTGSRYSEKFASLKEGDKVKVKGPFGTFLLDVEKDAVMLCGGIGITPLKNMVEYATARELPIKINLLFSNKTSEIPFKKELDEFAQKNPNFYITYLVTQPTESWQGRTGRINAELIKEIPDFKEKIFYICGPILMVSSMEDVLKEAGVPDRQIRVERFTGLVDY